MDQNGVFEDNVDKTVSLYDTLDENVTFNAFCKKCGCYNQTMTCMKIENCMDCVYGNFTDWGPCSKTCGVGVRRRHRPILHVAEGCNTTYQEVEACNEMDCPVPPPWKPWSEWTPCPDDCDVTTRSRNRECKIPGACDGDPMEIEKCEVKCANETTCDSAHETFNNCSNKMVDCSNIGCLDIKLPSYCVQSEEDEECEPGCICKTGYIRDQNNECVLKETCPCRHETDAGIIGSGDKRTTEDCKICECKMDGTMECKENETCCAYLSEWTDWNECEVECGPGKTHRYRSGTKGCDNDTLVESKDCEGVPCIPVCEELYNLGDSWREECIKCACIGINEMLEGIITCDKDPDADVNGEWGSWTSWSECSSSICEGMKTRNRYCENRQCDGKECEGLPIERKPCNENITCCTTLQWSPWSNCSVDCGSGKTNRTRELENPEDYEVCKDRVELEQTKDCQKDPCDVTDCELSDWSEFTECSVTCGGGIRTQFRTVVEEGSDCDKLNKTYEESCNEEECQECEDGMTFRSYTDCDYHTCYEYNNNITEKECGEPKFGCVCEQGLFMNDEEECVKPNVCSQCIHDGIVYEEGQSFDDKDNPCLKHTCVKSKLTDELKTCQYITCEVGKVLVQKEGKCCQECVDLEDQPDKCEKVEETKRIEFKGPKDTLCISREEITLSMCSGRCNNGHAYPDVYLGEKKAVDNSQMNLCECCQGKDVVRRTATVDCGDKEDVISYEYFTECECGGCKGGNEQNTGMPVKR